VRLAIGEPGWYGRRDDELGRQARRHHRGSISHGRRSPSVLRRAFAAVAAVALVVTPFVAVGAALVSTAASVAAGTVASIRIDGGPVTRRRRLRYAS